jgi:hypothetical protein
MVKFKLDHPSQVEALLSAEDYQRHIRE